ncbi:bifunctional UDP-N-acetylmuramoyl-tripeptide:D-alanyl-D-alanine ligase/alanine racemase [Mucilaginibacter sp. BJC16-A38]|uniref:bifunctional UDP-N-acetylmuramoyl-tripeptide:D-alanyl-D-alanine ligase/alanine racemase n=1 Tax=Mucilaginibacter phenanthrenivorans TaxID=1234842 RepID=UPI002157E097|nr:bifunctional UDP-N-acetylmuramoyl-tripeptide:D-alanyl-D-alanine ligase/alanine racemase [Mucilaginibacter phenanthrenivorans]MCR8556371.1 bifunctional UDP-N-acetylmuramoyl-tripeptide:D-alanyl-D-alanine ligase/alanine racemase [Mucilaginibacter phenanthrenivorans]
MLSNQYTIAAIRQIINAGGIIVKEYNISTLLTDSRRISNPDGALFFALSGRRNGHEFIAEAYASGVRNFVVRQGSEIKAPEANFLMVDDVLVALQTLAAYHRNRFELEVIGITGSNGKTIVKEWLYQLLSPDKNVVRNPKSYNSQIGVPLSVWQINEKNNLGIFEAGISTVNEIDKLEAIIKPSIGILTHIGPAHDEGFESRDQKVKEKLRLFKNCRLLIHNYDQLVNFKDSIPVKNCFTWSTTFKQADLYVFSSTVISKNFYLRAKYQGKEIECLIPFLDEASVENATVCWATMLAMGYSAIEADKRIEHLNAVSMRLELKSGINDCSVIDDSYNSDLQSLEIALNFLTQQNQHHKKTLILSDIYQSGLSADVLYRQVADMIKIKQADKFIGVGDALTAHQDYFDVPEKFFYPDTATMLQHLRALNFREETILIKGSRSFEFERISRALVQKAHETILEINLNALLNNLNFYRSKLKPGVKVMAMVKAFSYGSGTFEVANILQYNKVDYLAVAYIDEGVALRNSGISLPIMILNPEASAFDKLIEFNLEPVIYSFGLFDDFIKYAKEQNVLNFPIHLKIDTGMHRLGFENLDVETLCDMLDENRYVQIQSIFSHLVASEAAQHDEFTKKQISSFEKAYKEIEKTLGYKVIKHLSNTSGIIRWPGAHYDMVRLGIGLYGIDMGMTTPDSGLQPIASLKTSVAQVKKVKAGETISYSRSGRLAKNGQIATVRIGYADGYLRAFGNGVGKMLVNGKLAPTVGNITMDMCMIDVSGLDVREGDEVIIFNEQQRINELATQIGTIPYEILTNVSQRVKRVYFYE